MQAPFHLQAIVLLDGRHQIDDGHVTNGRRMCFLSCTSKIACPGLVAYVMKIALL